MSTKEKVVVNIKKMKTAYTHAGVLHADDVFSAAFLRILNPNIKIIRVNDVPHMGKNEFAFDIGRGEFDHHQPDVAVRRSGTKFAAFGLLWKKFGRDTGLNSVSCSLMDKEFIEELDAADNGQGHSAMAGTIAGFNPEWNEPKSQDDAFWDAVTFATEILKRRIAHYKAMELAVSFVEDAAKHSEDERIVVMDKFAPWRHILIPSAACFVVFPSKRGGYAAQVVPEGFNTQKAKVNFPTEWWGADEGQLPSGITFCHPSGFLISAKTLEAAMHACEEALKGEKA